MRITAGLLAFGLTTIILAACTMQDSALVIPPKPVSPPVSPQPRAAELRPGLLPVYFSGGLNQTGGGRPGEPVLHLDLATDGLLWESRLSEDYAIRMSGLIQLEAGIYRFAAISDDALRVSIDQTLVVDDLTPHDTARQSATVELRVTATGWYPFHLQYAQRKGPAVLQFRWQPPGAGGLMPVPGAALAHIP